MGIATSLNVEYPVETISGDRRLHLIDGFCTESLVRRCLRHAFLVDLDRALILDGLSLLSPGIIPCPDYRPEEWATVLANAWGFLDTFGSQAEALGWRTHELFGVHPTHGTIRVDFCGAIVLVIGGPVRAVTTDAIRFERVTYRRRPLAPVGIPIWEAAR